MKPRPFAFFRTLVGTSFLRICLTAATTFSVCQFAAADPLYWKGNAAATEWDSPGAWTTDSAGANVSSVSPTAGETAVFSADGITAAQTITLSSARAALGIQSVTAGAKVIRSADATNKVLTLQAGGVTIAASSGDITFGTAANPLEVSLAASQPWAVATGTVTVSNVLSGSGTLTKSGDGTLLLSSANTFSGGVILNAGVLTMNNAGALGSGPLTITGGTIRTAVNNAGIALSTARPIALNGSFSYTYGGTNPTGILDLNNGAVTLGANVTITSTAGLLNFGGPVSGSFGITKSGAGTLALMGNNTYSGQTTLGTSANLRINAAHGFSNTNIYLNGGVLELGGAESLDNAIVLGTDPGQVRFKTGATTIATASHGGFASTSGHRRISLTSEGIPNAPLVWNTTPHFISGPWGTSNGIFLLSTTLATGTVELTNDIDFDNADRRFSIRDGATTGGQPDAILSGKLTNGRISLQGGGTLMLTNTGNTLSGETKVVGPTVLRIPSFATLGTSHVVLEGGILEVPGDQSYTLGTGPGQVSFLTSGGFSTYGGNHSISIGSSSAPLVWSVDGFLADGLNLILSNGATDSVTIFTNPIDLNGLTRTIEVRPGQNTIDAALSGLITGSAGLTLAGGGSLHLVNPSNSYTGATTISSGSIVIDSLSNGGLPSPIGSSSADASNLVISSSGIRYVGTGSSTDRLFRFTTSFTLNSAGTGPLRFTASGPSATYSATAITGTTTVALTGIPDGENLLAGNFTNGADTNLTAISKVGRSAWTLAGTNTNTGNTDVADGLLILDYGSGGIPSSPTSGIVRIDNGSLALRGKNSGNTAITLNQLRFGIGNLGIANTLTLDANGGSGIALTVTTFNGNSTAGNTQTSNLIDISSHSANSITTGTLGSFTTVALTGTTSKNVIVANSSPNGRANTILRDSSGYGFATLSGTTSGSFGRTTLADATALDPDNSSTTGLYKVVAPDSSGTTLTRSSDLAFGALTLDATAGPVTLDFAGKTFGTSANNSGRGILITGGHPVTLTGTANHIYSPFIYHYGTADLNYSIPQSGLSLILGGTGFVNHTGNISGSALIYINGNRTRLAGASQNLSAIGGLWLSSGAILEIGADLNGATDGHFTNTIGTATSNVRFYGNSGVSAHGENRLVNFGGAAPAAPLIWGASAFLTTAGGTVDADAAFLLSSATSDATIEIVNPINLSLKDRVLEVANGSADTDAILKGVLSSPGGGIVKRGAGTLVLEAANTYTGNTTVLQGTLRLLHPYLADKSTIRIASGAKLDLPHGQTDTVGALIVNGTPVDPGIYGTADLPAALSGTGKLNVGGVPSTGTPYELWAASLPEGKRDPEQDADDDGILNLVEYAVGSDASESSPAVLSKASGTSGTLAFNRATGRTDITLILERSSSLTTGSWEAIATSTGGGNFVNGFPASVTLGEGTPAGGLIPISVTDNTTPVPVKMFYRLRVTLP